MGFPSLQQSSATVAASYLPLTNDVLGPAIGSIVGFCSFAALTIGVLLDPDLISPGYTASTAASAMLSAQRFLSCMGGKGFACTCRIDLLAGPEAASQGPDRRRQGRSHVTAALPADLPDLRGHTRCALSWGCLPESSSKW